MSTKEMVEVLESILEQMEKLTHNPTKPFTEVEKRFGVQRGYFEQEPEFPPITGTEVEKPIEHVREPPEREPEVGVETPTETQPPEAEVEPPEPFLKPSEAYTFGLTFEDKINGSKYTIPTSLNDMSQIEAEALLRNKMFEFLESINLHSPEISVTYEPNQFAIKVVVEGTEIMLFYFNVDNRWRLISAEVK